MKPNRNYIGYVKGRDGAFYAHYLASMGPPIYIGGNRPLAGALICLEFRACFRVILLYIIICNIIGMVLLSLSLRFSKIERLPGKAHHRGARGVPKALNHERAALGGYIRFPQGFDLLLQFASRRTHGNDQHLIFPVMNHGIQFHQQLRIFFW